MKNFTTTAMFVLVFVGLLLVSGTAFGQKVWRTDVVPLPPRFSHSSGTYEQGTVITIEGEEKYSKDKAYTIQYKTSDSKEYIRYKGEQIILDKTIDISATANYNPTPGFYASDCSSGYADVHYEVVMPKIKITPAPGAFYKGQTVTIACGRVPVLEYSFDGVTWKAYTTPLILDTSKTIFARAKWSTFTCNAQATYVVGAPPTPRILLAAGAYEQKTPVSIKPGDDSLSLYTNTDGSTKIINPDWEEKKIVVDPRSVLEYSFDGTTWQTYKEPLRLIDSVTIHARSRALGPDPKAGTLSSIVSTAYIVNVPMPDYELARGSYPKGTSISIKGDPRFILEYNTGNSNEWVEYKGPLTLEKDITLNARSRERAGINGAPPRISGTMGITYTIKQTALEHNTGVIAMLNTKTPNFWIIIIRQDSDKTKWAYTLQGDINIPAEALKPGTKVQYDLDRSGKSPQVINLRFAD